MYSCICTYLTYDKVCTTQVCISVCSFAALLTDLEEQKQELGVLSTGLSVTTLEEVFLKVSAGSEAALDQKQAANQTGPLVGVIARLHHLTATSVSRNFPCTNWGCSDCCE